MTTSTIAIPNHSPRGLRRRLARLLFAASTLAPIFSVVSTAGAFDSHDSISSASLRAIQDVCDAVQERERNVESWIFTDQYCGWKAAEIFTLPFDKIAAANSDARPTPVTDDQRIRVAEIVDRAIAAAQNARIAKDVAAIAGQEPVDVTRAVGVSSAAILMGSSPTIVSIQEGYLPYDLTRMDRIALRPYPIAIPQFLSMSRADVGTDKMVNNGPLLCNRLYVDWNSVAMPATVVRSQTPQASQWKNAWAMARTAASRWMFQLNERLIPTRNAEMEKANRLAASISTSMVAAVQPGSSTREATRGNRVGFQIASAVHRGHAIIAERAMRFGVVIASQRPVVAPEPKWALPFRPIDDGRTWRSAGEQLLARAGVDTADANAPDVAGEAQDAIVGNPPASHRLAVAGVAPAILQMPRAISGDGEDVSRHELARAEAVATAFDQTAATMERWALALRRAGDSVIRVARQTTMPPSTELR